LGSIAQTRLSRRFQINWRWNAAVIFIAFLLQFSLREYLFPFIGAAFPNWAYYWIPPVYHLWFYWCLSTDIILTVRDRLPALRPAERPAIKPAIDVESPADAPELSGRRHFLTAGTAAVCALPAIVTTFGIVTRNDFAVQERSLIIPNLPKDLQGLRIVQLSDLHTGPFFDLRMVERAVDAANGLRSDLTVVTGDLISTDRDPLEACVDRLARLKATAGVWGCHGNHERFSSAEWAATEYGARHGIRFLRHEAESLKFGDHRLNLAGVDYQSFRKKPYLVGAEDLVEKDQLNLLLSHNPDVFPTAVAKGFDVVLAGHTHGGQINVEILHHDLNISRVFTPYAKGLYREGSQSVYVNSGLGTIGIPVRLGAPPEITLLTLMRAT
jgi:predicted MPP superfamily phosphohydrolase